MEESSWQQALSIRTEPGYRLVVILVTKQQHDSLQGLRQQLPDNLHMSSLEREWCLCHICFILRNEDILFLMPPLTKFCWFSDLHHSHFWRGAHMISMHTFACVNQIYTNLRFTLTLPKIPVKKMNLENFYADMSVFCADTVLQEEYQLWSK